MDPVGVFREKARPAAGRKVVDIEENAMHFPQYRSPLQGGAARGCRKCRVSEQRDDMHPHGDTFPLFYPQGRFWLLHQMEPGKASNRMNPAVRLRGPLDTRALKRWCSRSRCPSLTKTSASRNGKLFPRGPLGRARRPSTWSKGHSSGPAQHEAQLPNRPTVAPEPPGPFCEEEGRMDFRAPIPCHYSWEFSFPFQANPAFEDCSSGLSSLYARLSTRWT